MNTTAHTPTPYFVEPDGFTIKTAGGMTIATTRQNVFHGKDKPDAAFIVEACNAHDSLKAQNAELVKALRDLHVTLTGPGTRNDRISGAVVFIAAALAKVTP